MRRGTVGVASQQEGIFRHLVIDRAGELEIRHLQQTDGLLQLRRQNEALLLPQLETDAGGEAHPWCLEREPLSEIDPPHRRVGDDLRGRENHDHDGDDAPPAPRATNTFSVWRRRPRSR